MRWSFLLLLLPFVPLLGAADEGFRVWTDREGRTVEARLETQEQESVTLRLRNGQTAKVPLAELSEADRSWLVAQKDPYTGPPAEQNWPRNVQVGSGSSDATVILEDGEENQFIYETESYRFISDARLSPALVREFSRVFEGARLVNCLLPLDLRPIPEPGREKFHAHIFSEPADYLAAGGVPGSAGIYSPMDRALKLPMSSLGVRTFGEKVTIDYQSEDYRTLIHEITHQMMNAWLPKLPVWLIEGSAEYVELAEYDNGRFRFSRHERDLASRLADYYGTPFPMVPVDTLLTMDHAAWQNALESNTAGLNYASALVLVWFFYHFDDAPSESGIRAYFKDARNLPRGTDFKPLIAKHLLRGRTPTELQEAIVKAFRRKGIKIAFQSSDRL